MFNQLDDTVLTGYQDVGIQNSDRQIQERRAACRRKDLYKYRVRRHLYHNALSEYDQRRISIHVQSDDSCDRKFSYVLVPGDCPTVAIDLQEHCSRLSHMYVSAQTHDFYRDSAAAIRVETFLGDFESNISPRSKMANDFAQDSEMWLDTSVNSALFVDHVGEEMKTTSTLKRRLLTRAHLPLLRSFYVREHSVLEDVLLNLCFADAADYNDASVYDNAVRVIRSIFSAQREALAKTHGAKKRKRNRSESVSEHGDVGRSQGERKSCQGGLLWDLLYESRAKEVCLHGALRRDHIHVHREQFLNHVTRVVICTLFEHRLRGAFFNIYKRDFFRLLNKEYENFRVGSPRGGKRYICCRGSSSSSRRSSFLYGSRPKLMVYQIVFLQKDCLHKAVTNVSLEGSPRRRPWS